MHTLYSVAYTLITDDGKFRDLFADGYLFTQDAVQNETIRYTSFADFYRDASSHKYPWKIPGSNYNYGTTLFRKKPYVQIYGIYQDYSITQSNFKSPISIEITYAPCSDTVFGIDFFKRHLSASDYFIFLQERLGQNSDPALRLLLGVEPHG